MSSSTYYRSESSRSHRHSSGKDSNHKKHHSSKSVGTGPRFLFVVNEVTFDPSFNQHFPVDSWGNHVPPSTAAAYEREHVGRVFRYDGGHVAPAPEYSWYRPGIGFAGGVVRYSPNGSFQMMIPYKTGTVFACSPHLPIIVAECDVSCEPTFVYKENCHCHNIPGGGEATRWNILSFERVNASSIVSAVALGSPYVVGRDPSWIPALVPRVFENPDENVPRSTGLGGDLPTLIGLMAFHGRTGRASDVFSSGKWQHNQWHGSARAPTGYPDHSGTPRGFVVHIASDVPIDGLAEDAADHLKNEFERLVVESGIIFVRG